MSCIATSRTPILELFRWYRWQEIERSTKTSKISFLESAIYWLKMSKAKFPELSTFWNWNAGHQGERRSQGSLMLSGTFSCSNRHVEVEFKNKTFSYIYIQPYYRPILCLCRIREHGGDKFGFTAGQWHAWHVSIANFMLICGLVVCLWMSALRWKTLFVDIVSKWRPYH